ncbi:MAG TPA: UDP-N-acetylmuramoyl-L-alanine--D-glutamate ligase [Candidatus Limnocylindria bacterium]|nr:UDP-N-acetylmuramoyl-L-alanine--D-glutamate ligase [Candidatus Limnocylindria bacterium]
MTAQLPRRALVVGMGLSGEAAAAALERRGVEVVTADRKDGTDNDLSLLDGVDVLVKSPGVPGENPLVAEARGRGVPVWSEVELGYRLLPEGVRLVGVTGTKGKTTTVRLLGAMLEAAGRPVALAGNEQPPLSDVADAVEAGTWIVVELTSFQLEDVHTLALDVALLLNLEPDHLDRHGTFEAYRDAKLRIFERARNKIEWSPDEPLPAEPRIRGAHNRENAAAATRAARELGVPEAAIAEALVSFPGVEHRLEPIGEIEGVLYVNDSKATNVAAAVRALAAYADEPVRLIAGGRGKGQSFEPLAAAVGPNVKAVYLIGEAAEEIAAAIGPRAIVAGDLATALARASADARAGDVVLLSPACASFDQFRDFVDRGEEFRRLVQNLEG